MPPQQKSRPPSSGQELGIQLDPAHDDESFTKGGDNPQTNVGMLQAQTTLPYFLRLCARENDTIEQGFDSLALVTDTNEDQIGKETLTFLSLPPEIRNKIYRDDAVHDCHGVVLPQSGYKSTMRRLLWQPPITRVNQQIRNESLSIIYGECEFIHDFFFHGFPEINPGWATHDIFLDPFHAFYALLDHFTPKSWKGLAQQSPETSRVRSGNSSGNDSVSAGSLEPTGFRPPSTLRFLTILEITVEFPEIDKDSVDPSISDYDWESMCPLAMGFWMCSASRARQYSVHWHDCKRRLSNKRLDWEDPATVAEEYSRCIGKLDYGFQILEEREKYHLSKAPADLPSSGLPIDVDVMCSIARHCPALTNSVWTFVILNDLYGWEDDSKHLYDRWIGDSSIGECIKLLEVGR